MYYVLIPMVLTLSMTAHCATKAPNVWEVMRKEFTLNHEVSRPEVQHQLRWLSAHPSYINQLARSEPYIYHIVNEVKQRHLPGELAIIPLIESAFDPFAYSGAGAAGLWQLMPGTGTDLGLKRDWWFDARRSIGPSTTAALNYLTYLHKFFHGNWILAIAAYDSGEGTMARIIKNSNQSSPHVNFWTLNVPNETKAYIPRLLALAEVIQNPQRYRVQLPEIPHTPYFEEVNIGSQIDLNHAAKLAGISYQDLIKLNPGYNHWTTAPYRPYKLLIPANRVNDFSRNLANVPNTLRVSWSRPQVSAGEHLQLSASARKTLPHAMPKSKPLKSNQNTLPAHPAKPMPETTGVTNPQRKHPPTRYKVIHVVQYNDSYPSLQKRYGVSLQQIRAWNHLKRNAVLHKGQTLILWKAVSK